MSRIAVVGTGYVGLTTGAYLAHLGHEVVCADVIADKVARLSRGEVPIVEPGPRRVGARGNRQRPAFVRARRCRRCQGSEFVFLCVPTPHG